MPAIDCPPGWSSNVSWNSCCDYVELLIFKSKSFKDIIIRKEVVFSLCYLAGITFIVLIFRGGNLFSLNRFVFAVPFIIVVADCYFKRKISFSKKQLMFTFIIILSFWLFLVL